MKIRATVEIDASSIGKANVILEGAMKLWMSTNREVIRFRIISMKEVGK